MVPNTWVIVAFFQPDREATIAAPVRVACGGQIVCISRINGDYQINVTQNGTALPQTMYLTVHN